MPRRSCVADGGPTPYAQSGFRQRTPTLDGALRDWSALRAQIGATVAEK
jgi:hypothetical protein